MLTNLPITVWHNTRYHYPIYDNFAEPNNGEWRRIMVARSPRNRVYSWETANHFMVIRVDDESADGREYFTMEDRFLEWCQDTLGYIPMIFGNGSASTGELFDTLYGYVEFQSAEDATLFRMWV